MSHYKPYSTYKDSGVDWIGQIPENWDAKRAKYLFERKQRAVRDVDEIVTAFRDGQVTLRKNRREDGFTVALKESGYQGVRKNDLVIHAMDAFAGAVGVSDSDGKCSPVYSCCEAKTGILSSFYGYLIRIMAVTGFIESLTKGIRERSTDFRWTDFSALELPLPTLREQEKIVEYLDRETARIDALIEKKQRQIELLKEKRQAIITQAVTKGLDPDVPMKDSGVEWLEEVPEHWRMSQIGWLASKLTYGFTNPMPTEDEGPKMLTANDIGWGSIDYANARSTSHEAFAQLLTDKSRPRTGDILITKDGTLGRVAVHDGTNACINQSVAILRVRNDLIDENYLCLLLMSSEYQGRMIFEAGGTTIKHIYISRLAKMPVAIPSFEEQKTILKYSSNRIDKIDSAVCKVDKSLELLKERRSALITAAVTGQIDVREEV